jgi:uncharacterized SAM-binding protein YcdF (DUF218 family)
MPILTARGWVVAMVLLLIVLFVVATSVLIVWPSSDPPRAADAVVALGGDAGQLRAKEAIRLARAGYAPVAVISLGGATPAPCPRPVPRIQIICFRADPLDTRGEAEFVGTLAARRHWDTLIVVPGRSQVTRARMLFERCTDAHLDIVPVNDPPLGLFYDIAYEWGSLAKAVVVDRSC